MDQESTDRTDEGITAPSFAQMLHGKVCLPSTYLVSRFYLFIFFYIFFNIYIYTLGVTIRVVLIQGECYSMWYCCHNFLRNYCQLTTIDSRAVTRKKRRKLSLEWHPSTRFMVSFRDLCPYVDTRAHDSWFHSVTYVHMLTPECTVSWFHSVT